MTEKTEYDSETQPVSIWPVIWKYSFIIAACSFAYTLLLYVSGLVGNTGAGLISFVIFIVLLVFEMRKYRKNNGGYMTFGTAAIIGIMTSIFATLLQSSLNAVYLAFIDNTALSVMTEKALQKLQATPGISQQQIDVMTKIYENFLFTPAGMFVIGLVSGIIGGVIISLILAAILKKSPPVTG